MDLSVLEKGPVMPSMSKPQLYGGFGGFTRNSVFTRRQRQRLNVNAVCGCLFAPWISFCVVYALTSFTLHYSHPFLTKIAVGIAFVATAAIGIFAGKHVQKKLKETHAHNENIEPTWFAFLFITMSIAVIVGAVLGYMNFHGFMQRYYDYLALNTYEGVNVATTKGGQVMDGSIIEFINGTVLDLRKSMGFKNMRTYCVAPITVTNDNNVRTELGNYDFWAVGTDCCSGEVADFHCGEYDNYKAKGALRLLADDERAFYRLAVQQAEAVHHLRATHPLFFYWTENPKAEMESWRNTGYKFFFISMFAHFVFQCFVVMLGVLGFASLGNFS